MQRWRFPISTPYPGGVIGAMLQDQAELIHDLGIREVTQNSSLLEDLNKYLNLRPCF